MVCSELLIKVSARSEEGASPVGTVSGGFPVGEWYQRCIFVIFWLYSQCEKNLHIIRDCLIVHLSQMRNQKPQLMIEA